MPARASVAMEMQVPCTDGHFPVSQQTLAEDGTPPRACLMGRLAIAALHGTHSVFPLKSVPGRHTSQTRVVAGCPRTRPQQIFFLPFQILAATRAQPSVVKMGFRMSSSCLFRPYLMLPGSESVFCMSFAVFSNTRK